MAVGIPFVRFRSMAPTLRRLVLVLALAACGDDSSGPGGSPNVTDPSPLPPVPEAADGGVDDASLPPDDGVTPPDPDQRFLTELPGPDCTPEVAADWTPQHGPSGGIDGTGNCGSSTGSCPTSYVDGNSGEPCSSAADCTGRNPVCLTGEKYPGGTCAASGCELGSNFGCPAGDTCVTGGDGETYCLEGCGYDVSGCFVHCARAGYACFNSESRTLGMCLGAAGTSQCDPAASNLCTQAAFGDGICVQTAWDDQTVGRCFETCDPIAQDCSRDGEGCYVLREYAGYPVCFQSWGFPEGASCERMTQCAEGLRCACDSPDPAYCAGLTNMHCRAYCPTDGSVPCPAGTTCRALRAGSSWGSCQPPL